MKKRRVLSLLCVLLLALLALPLRADAAAVRQVYQMAVNDVLLDAENGLSAANMPLSSNATIYVPYTVFDRNQTGVDLGVSHRQSMDGSSQTLILYDLGASLNFDVNAQTCIDGNTGENLPMRAIIRNGRIYVPASRVCKYFGLRFSFRATRDAGILVRICNDEAVLSDQQFLQSASSLMKYRYDRYLQSQTAPPDPPLPPPPAVPSEPPVRPQPTPVPTPSVTPQAPGVPVRLAVSCVNEGDLAVLPDVLSRRGVKAVFLFTPELLPAQERQVRTILGMGHQVGLLVDGSDPETARAELDRGRDLLERMAWYRPRIAALEKPGEGVEKMIGDEGWVLWETTVDARPAEGVQHLAAGRIADEVRAHRGTAALLLDDSVVSATGLERLLTLLEEAACPILPALETGLIH